jgi:uracil-DNA glycosylase family 4
MPSDDAPIGAEQRREALKQVYARTQSCTLCPELASTRKSVVFGSGNADADLMFVGEAPGASEDEQGVPFVGQAGKLLEKLLGEIGLQRSDVFIANTLKCRPPGNRDPLPLEIENCRDFLYEQVELIQPKVICTLGNFATKLLRDDKTGITRLHGQPELLAVGQRMVRLYPIFHPAAALYTPRMMQTLREDFQRLPELLAMPAPDQPDWLHPPEPAPERSAPSTPEADVPPSAEEADQLGLF